MKRRKSERAQERELPERRNRVQFRDGGWYISTREHPLVGPYATEFDAQLNASKLVSQLAQADPETKPQTTIQSFLSDPATRPIDPQPAVSVRLAAQSSGKPPAFSGGFLGRLFRRGGQSTG